MSAPPIAINYDGLLTLDDMVQRIIDDADEPANDKNRNRIVQDINDAIGSIWMSMLLASLSRWSKGPVNQVIPANQQSVQLVSVPNPTVGPNTGISAGGNLGARTVYVAFALVTDSGSTTKVGPTVAQAVPANSLINVNYQPASIPADTIGWYCFAGNNADGSDLGMQGGLQQFGVPWYEPPAGLTPAPLAPRPPAYNTTGDNIFSIQRIDVQNVDMTWTNWIQTNLSSSWFTEFQHKVSTTTTWMPFVYDFIADRQLEVRPAPGYDVTATYFYTVRPRRLRFPNSRLPYTQFSIQEFVHDSCLGKFLLKLYEYEAADRWGKLAEMARQRTVLQVAAGNWNQNLTVRSFMR